MAQYLNNFVKKFLATLTKRAQVIISTMSMRDEAGRYNSYWNAHLANLNNSGMTQNQINQEVVEERSGPIAKVSSQIRSPALLSFDYKGDYFLVIVAAARGGIGRYNNRNTGNQLLTCFDVTDQDPEMIAIVLDSLYNSTYVGGVFSYKEGVSQSGLKRIFAKDTFRTFNFLKMGSIEIMNTHG